MSTGEQCCEGQPESASGYEAQMQDAGSHVDEFEPSDIFR